MVMLRSAEQKNQRESVVFLNLLTESSSKIVETLSGTFGGQNFTFDILFHLYENIRVSQKCNMKN